MVVRVSEVVTIGSIVVRPQWQGFEGAVTGLVHQLVEAGRLPAALADAAVQRVCLRETMASTAMVDIGVSIPHARLDGVDGIIAALAVDPVAVYQLAAGLPIPIVTLVLSSPQLTGEHLNFLSSVSLLLQSARTREQLRRATTAEEILRVIHTNEQTSG
jgi:mannitol/fructose-specific phosphotransferase system IIA component (Ntr-type)